MDVPVEELKEHEFLSSITCAYCSNIFSEPIVLPCERSICTSCLFDARFLLDPCKYCAKRHYFDSFESLRINKHLKEQIRSYVSRFTTNKNEPNVYESMSRLPTVSSSSMPFMIPNETNAEKQTREDMKTKLGNYFQDVTLKVNMVNNGYKLAIRRIENEFNEICDEINETAEHFKNEIDKKQKTMIQDIESYKQELLGDYEQRYTSNAKFLTLQRDINQTYETIVNEISRLDANKCDISRLRGLMTRLELINTKINDHQRDFPERDPKIGLVFVKNNSLIDVPFIGDILYESIYKIDIVSKINSFNNEYQYREFDFSSLIGHSPLARHIGIISKNKFLLLTEKIVGKVKSTKARIVYYDGSILKEHDINDVGNFVTYLIYDKYIVLVFRNSKKCVYVHMYDLNLNLMKEIDVDYDISYMLMNDEFVYLITDHEPIVNKYDLKLKYDDSFGQIRNEKKKYFVKDELFAITKEKIFSKFKNVIRVTCLATGELLHVIDKIDAITQATIHLDFNKEKYIVFNGFNLVSFHNHKGEIIASNKLRKVNVKIDEFQFSRSGHFAFINYEKCIVIVI